MNRTGLSEAHVKRKTIFGMTKDGQIHTFEGCARCNASKLTHSPIKIPHEQWENGEASGFPIVTRWYDNVCFHCARAILASRWNIFAWFYRRRYKLERLTWEKVQCPKILN